jgi:hypothetical protein
MPRVLRAVSVGRDGGVVVAGVYSALLLVEQKRCSRPDPRLMHRYHGDGRFCTTPGVVCDHEPLPTRRSPHLDALEAGRAVTLLGRQIRMLLPESRRRRGDAFDWFRVTSDDRVTPCEPPT